MSPGATGRKRAVAVAAGAGLALLAAAGIIAVSLVSATPVPAAKRTPLPTTTAGVTSFSGTVQSGATRLDGVRVGFWSRTGRDVASTTTGAKGTFTLRVPSGIRGFAYAGARPDAAAAVFALRGRSYVRGVIGATQPTGTAYRIHQGHASAVAARLAGGQAVRFDLQRPGVLRIEGERYFEGTDGLTSGLVELVRRDGSGMGGLTPGRGGVWTSKPVVPGTYLLRGQPVAPYLPRTTPVTVRAGGTTVVRPTFSTGATVTGRITSGGAPAAGVAVHILKDGRLYRTADDATDADGRYSVRSVAAGDYRLRLAVNQQVSPQEAEPEVDWTPTTSDDYLPATRDFSVSAQQTSVTVDASLQPAGHVTGTVTGLGGDESPRVYATDATGTIVRTRVVGLAAVRTYDLGGLVPGRQYTVAVLRNADRRGGDSVYGSASLTATAGTVTRDITVGTPTLTLRGSAAGAVGSTVRVRALGAALPLFGAGATVDATGHYVVRSLIPATYEVQVVPGDAAAGLASPKQRVPLAGSTTLDLAVRSGRPGTWRGRFVSGAAPAPAINLSALSAAGDRALLPASDADGRAEKTGMRPGTYRYQRSPVAEVQVGAVTLDGPWWYAVPTGSFTIRAGEVADVGAVALHVRAR